MCGIAGFLGWPSGPVPAAGTLRRMVGALAHRGPDAHGQAVIGPAGLGHARLSIIDLAGGRQPMADAEGELHVTFNGEIFNYVELRDELAARGHRFRTQSDTEVILAVYRADGIEGIARLNGDFAFALWDAPARRLVLARDRIGVRPLFYARRPEGLFFASEVKALLAVPGLRAELDPVALDQIFTLWAPLPPRTQFKDILELPPGHVLVAEGDTVTTRAYWRLDFPDAAEEADLGARGEADVADELRHLLTDATRIRLRSDVPVGCYLSGGLDSSVIAALAKDLAPGRLRTFSVGFETPEFDEGEHQRAMVAALGTEHEATLCTDAEIGRVFPEVIRHTERTVLRTAPAPLFALSRLVNERGFKVVLTGEGADEILGGYDIFKEAKVRRFCARRPESRLRPLLLRRLYPYLPALRSQSQGYLSAFFGAGLDRTDDPLFSHLPRFRSTAAARMVFSAEFREGLRGYDALDDLRAALPERFARWHPLAQAQYLETRLLLPGYILASQGDRVAMAHAVEGRFPFLDPRVVDFAARIPSRLKLRGLREKHVLREAMRGRLPERIGARVKQPYRAPASEAFAGAPYLAECLGRAALDGGPFDPDVVARLAAKAARQPLTSFRDSTAFVGTLSTQLWRRHFTPAARAAAPAPEPALAEALA